MKLITTFLLSVILFGSLCAQHDPMSRPAHFPTPPETDASLFFIQRNKNVNTIMYDARLKTDGSFNDSSPIDAYWLRYTSDGHRSELGWLEKKFAYGYDSDRKKGKEDEFWIELTAYDDRRITLKKDKNGKPVATLTLNGRQCQLKYIWVYADESGSWPKVIHVDIYGRDLNTGEEVYERIEND